MCVCVSVRVCVNGCVCKYECVCVCKVPLYVLANNRATVERNPCPSYAVQVKRVQSARTHTRTRTRTYIETQTQRHVLAVSPLHTCKTQNGTFEYTHTHARTHAYAYAHIHTNTHIQSYNTHAHTHVKHTHTHTHARVLLYAAVIPLSPNSGLIGWVPNCDTLHALIREFR